MRGRVRFFQGVCYVSVRDSSGVIIWEDNSGARAWPGLLEATRDIVAAATLMQNKGQNFRSWSEIVDEAGGWL